MSRFGERENIFDLLDDIHERPRLFVRSSDEAGMLLALETMIWGYCEALRVQGIVEGVPSMSHFSTYLFTA